MPRQASFLKAERTASDVWVKINGAYVDRMRIRNIFLDSPATGHLADGRPVKFENDRWIYEPI